MTASVFADKYS